MREIKFRAWCEGKMIYPELDLYSIKNQYDEPSRFVFSDGEYDGHFQTPSAVMQFTGLHDKNGKEIYEGDILGSKTKATSNLEVVWVKPWGRFMLAGRRKATIEQKSKDFLNGIQLVKKYEVIGNIYENPELLTH